MAWSLGDADGRATVESVDHLAMVVDALGEQWGEHLKSCHFKNEN